MKLKPKKMKLESTKLNNSELEDNKCSSCFGNECNEWEFKTKYLCKKCYYLVKK